MTHKIKIRDEVFEMHPLGGLYWERKSVLMISDAHLGKVSHFRKAGVSIPQKVAYQNVANLDEIVNHYQPFEICFLGDLFHSEDNNEWHLFENWVAKTPAKVTLVNGNHDIIDPLKFKGVGIETMDELICEGFLLCHHPEVKDGHFTICGHVHPATRIKLGIRSLKFPCYYLEKDNLILPAFGQFTGNHVLKSGKGKRIFPIVENEVLEI